MTHEINAPMPTRIELYLSVSFGEKANCRGAEEKREKNHKLAWNVVDLSQGFN